MVVPIRVENCWKDMKLDQSQIYLVQIDKETIYTARFFSFHITWGHSNKAVQETVPFSVIRVNDKAFIMVKRN